MPGHESILYTMDFHYYRYLRFPRWPFSSSREKCELILLRDVPWWFSLCDKCKRCQRPLLSFMPLNWTASFVILLSIFLHLHFVFVFFNCFVVVFLCFVFFIFLYFLILCFGITPSTEQLAMSSFFCLYFTKHSREKHVPIYLINFHIGFLDFLKEHRSPQSLRDNPDRQLWQLSCLCEH